MAVDRVETDVAEVVDGGTEADRLDDRRGAGLEAVRRLGVRRARHGDRLDHLAAAVEGRELVEQLLATPQHADARRAADLVAGEDQEVAVDGLDVDRELRRGLRGVDHREGAERLGARHQVDDRVDRAEHVGHPGEGDDLGVLVDQLVGVA